MKKNLFVKLVTNPAISRSMPKFTMPLAEEVPDDIELNNITLYRKIHNSTIFEGGVQFTVLELWYRTEEKEEGLLGEFLLEGADRFDEADQFARKIFAYSGANREDAYVLIEVIKRENQEDDFNVVGGFKDYETAKLAAKNAAGKFIFVKEKTRYKSYDVDTIEELETSSVENVLNVRVTGYYDDKAEDSMTEIRKYYIKETTIR